MASLDEITHEIFSSTNAALGCAVVDLRSGLLLSIAHQVDEFTQAFVEAAAAAAVDMFRGSTVQDVQALVARQRGTQIENAIQEIQMTTPHTYHFMAVVPHKPTALLVLITHRQTHVGMGWASVRVNLANIAPFIP